MILVLLLACTPKGSFDGETPSAIDDSAPEISAISWACDIDEGEWRFQIDTVRWSSGAWLWLATEDVTWERHALYSEAAAADGSTDQLGATLSVVADWRDAVAGSSTRFRCQDQLALAFQATIYTLDGDAAADCRRWGAAGVLDDVDGIEACDSWLETQDSGAADSG